ncbi:MAG: MFS transporter, partial [Actinomycetota bacterium]
AFPEEPIVFVVGQYYQGDVDAAATLASGVLVGPDVAVITGDGLYEPPADLVERARAAAAAESARLEDHPGPLGNPLHTLRVLAGLFFLLVLPGSIASSWFGLRDGPSRVALIPGMSIVLTLLSGIAVLAVWRGPLTTAKAWAAVGLATLAALALRVGRPKLERVLGSFGGFFNRMFAVFSNRSFAALMGVQFLALMGDGVVQGSLAKSIAFGGEKGFDVTSAPSARYLLFVVLALYVPYTFVSPFAGAFIDRFHRRALLAGSNIFRAAVIVVLALLLALFGDGLPDAFLIFTILVTLACTRLLLAIKSAGLPGVLQGKDLLQGNGLSQAGGAVFQIMGGGFALIGTTLAPVWIVALSGAGLYLIAAVVARRVEHLEASRRTTRFAEEAKRVVRDIAAGVREVARRPAAALGVTSFQALRMEFFGFVALVFALEARFLLTGKDADQTVVAIAGGAGAAGAAIGMVVAQKLKDRVPPVRLLLASMLAIAVGVIAFGGVPTLLGFSSILFIGGFGFFLGKISTDTIVQQAMPDDFRGRAFSLFDIAYNLGWILPALVLALVWDEDRVRAILIASGVVFLGVTALIWHWSVRIRDRLAPQDDLVEVGEEG